MINSIILTYHGILTNSFSPAIILDPSTNRYFVSSEQFDRATSLILKKDCKTIAELLDLDHGNYVTISFDDGFISDFDVALPVLLNKELKGTFFITVDNIGKKDYCNISQLREMVKSGMEIGSHGLTHQYLTQLSPLEIKNEIGESKDRLEQHLGIPIISFAAVGGHYKNWMYKHAWQVGYKAFATMSPGKSMISENQAIFKRNHIQKHHNLRYVQSILDGHSGQLLKNSIIYYLLRAPKIMLGLNRYDNFKNQFFKVFSKNWFEIKSPSRIEDEK